MIRMIGSVLVVLLLASLAGCAGGHKSQESPLGDQDKDGAAGHYFDGDDGSVRFWGDAADAGETRAIEGLVKRYYAAAATENGRLACALTYYLDVETLPEGYGQPPGPLWLHGADMCPVLLGTIFRHFHNELTEAVHVTAVRVSGERAYALVGFQALPAGYVKARREGGRWKIDGLLAAALP